MISHRLANVRNADCIYALEKGDVAEYGTHSQLLQNDGVYAKLWKTQSELENFGEGRRV
jgi:ABC-type multidrug transport system fused ATPase/permease subunit